MSAPFLLSVVLNLQTALQAIATGSGYFYTVKSTSVVLDAVALATVSVTEVPYIVLGHRIEPVNREWKSSRGIGQWGAIEDKWRIWLESRIDAPGTDTSKKMTALSQFDADLEVALTKDPRRGGNALFTYVGQSNRYTGLANQNMCFLETPVDVLIQRVYGQP